MVTAAARTKIATGGPGLACGPRSPQNYAIVIAGAMPASLGGHRESHLLLCRLHGCRRLRGLFAWAFHRVRMGLTCEPHRISRPLFSFSMDVLGTRCVDYQTKIRAAARVANPRSPPPVPTPIFFGLTLDHRCRRVLHLEPIGRAAGPIARTQPLRHDALRRGGIFMGSAAFGVCLCARLGPLLPALVAFAATPRDAVGQIFSAVVVSNLGTRLNVLDGAYDAFVA